MDFPSLVLIFYLPSCSIVGTKGEENFSRGTGSKEKTNMGLTFPYIIQIYHTKSIEIHLF